jgi:hypothetical protein
VWGGILDVEAVLHAVLLSLLRDLEDVAINLQIGGRRASETATPLSPLKDVSGKCEARRDFERSVLTHGSTSEPPPLVGFHSFFCPDISTTLRQRSVSAFSMAPN